MRLTATLLLALPSMLTAQPIELRDQYFMLDETGRYIIRMSAPADSAPGPAVIEVDGHLSEGISAGFRLRDGNPSSVLFRMAADGRAIITLVDYGGVTDPVTVDLVDADDRPLLSADVAPGVSFAFDAPTLGRYRAILRDISGASRRLGIDIRSGILDGPTIVETAFSGASDSLFVAITTHTEIRTRIGQLTTNTGTRITPGIGIRQLMSDGSRPLWFPASPPPGGPSIGVSISGLVADNNGPPHVSIAPGGALLLIGNRLFRREGEALSSCCDAPRRSLLGTGGALLTPFVLDGQLHAIDLRPNRFSEAQRVPVSDRLADYRIRADANLATIVIASRPAERGFVRVERISPGSDDAQILDEFDGPDGFLNLAEVSPNGNRIVWLAPGNATDLLLHSLGPPGATIQPFVPPVVAGRSARIRSIDLADAGTLLTEWVEIDPALDLITARGFALLQIDTGVWTLLRRTGANQSFDVRSDSGVAIAADASAALYVRLDRHTVPGDHYGTRLFQTLIHHDLHTGVMTTLDQVAATDFISPDRTVRLFGELAMDLAGGAIVSQTIELHPPSGFIGGFVRYNQRLALVP